MPCLLGTFPVAMLAQMIGLLVSGSSERDLPLVEQRPEDVPFAGVHADDEDLGRLLARAGTRPDASRQDEADRERQRQAGGEAEGLVHGSSLEMGERRANPMTVSGMVAAFQ